MRFESVPSRPGGDPRPDRAAGAALAQSQPSAADGKAENGKRSFRLSRRASRGHQRIVKDISSRIRAFARTDRRIAEDAPGTANPDKSQVIKNNEALLFRSPRQVVLAIATATSPWWNSSITTAAIATRASRHADADQGRSQAEIRPQGIADPGTGSVEAARVAVAVRMQDTAGRNISLHQNMMGTRGQANRETAIAAAKAQASTCRG